MKKVRTYIEGLDEILDGGIPEGHAVLIVGSPGTMKSSLAYTILHNNALRGEKGLYICLEQSRASLLDHAKSLGLDIEKTEKRLSILDLGALRSKIDSSWEDSWLDFLKMYAQSIKRGFNYSLLALDSLDALEILAKFKNHRMELFELFKWLRGLKCTCFIIGEIPRGKMLGAVEESYEVFSKHKEDYLADGVIHLKMEKRGDFEVQRRIRCVKMRSVRHKTSHFALIFDNGFKVTRVMS